MTDTTATAQEVFEAAEEALYWITTAQNMTDVVITKEGADYLFTQQAHSFTVSWRHAGAAAMMLCRAYVAGQDSVISSVRDNLDNIK